LAQLRLSFHLVRRYKDVISRNAARQLEVAARLGIVPTPLTAAQVADHCNPASKMTKY
jgi:hypothetical protein